MKQIIISPNPARDIACIEIKNPPAGQASIEIINLLGRPVRDIYKGFTDSTNLVLPFNAKALPPGHYFARASLNGSTFVKKFIISD